MYLIPKDKAPKCSKCGRIQWKAIWKPSSSERHTTHDEHGNRLGYVLSYRKENGNIICWNGQQCEKRKQKNACQ